MTMQFMVDTLIDYQFQYMAKAAYKGDALTAFLGRFYGRYLNITELVLQLFFTTAIVKRLGVGGTMQIMPISLGLASLATFASPSVLTASLARLVEASTRYTLARTVQRAVLHATAARDAESDQGIHRRFHGSRSARCFRPR